MIPEHYTASQAQNALTSIQLHLRVSWIQLQYYWRFTDRSTKMVIFKRALRTKQILLLLITSVFVFLAGWIRTHPDIHPLPTQRTLYLEKSVPKGSFAHKDFADYTFLIKQLGLDFIFNGSVTPLEKTDMADFNTQIWTIPLPTWVNNSQPAVVTALFDSTTEYAPELQLIASIQRHAPEAHLLIFDMRANVLDDKVAIFCNLTKVCSTYGINFKIFPFTLLPGHVSKQDVGAYKAIFVQKALQHFPLAMWVDSSYVIKSSGLSKTWNHTMKYDVTTFELENHCPAVSYTFKNMLSYFDLRQEDLYFTHMIESGIYAFRLSELSKPLLQMWLNCSLTADCINPTGADSRDCGYDCNSFQPKIVYIKCHKYETAALSASLIKHKQKYSDNVRLQFEEYPIKKVSPSEPGDYNLTEYNIEIDLEKKKLNWLSKRRRVNLLERLDDSLYQSVIKA